jgi:hypothetical protein
MSESFDDVAGTGDDEIDRRGKGHGHVFREPLQCLADALAPCFPYPGAVAAVGMESGADVPAVGAVW